MSTGARGKKGVHGGNMVSPVPNRVQLEFMEES
jgi:hypothetical protein